MDVCVARVLGMYAPIRTGVRNRNIYIHSRRSPALMYLYVHKYTVTHGCACRAGVRNVYVHSHECSVCIHSFAAQYVMVFYDFVSADNMRGGGLGSRPKKMYGERLGDGVEYHLMKPTHRR